MYLLDALSECRLTSGVPFGMVAMPAGLTVLSLGGLVVYRRARRSGIRILATMVGVGAAARLILGVLAALFVRVDLNPSAEAATMLGRWTSGVHTLELRQDGTFLLEDSGGRTGRWSLQDWNLILIPDTGEKWRVVRANGENRVVRGFPEDSDLWDGRLGFRRMPDP